VSASAAPTGSGVSAGTTVIALGCVLAAPLAIQARDSLALLAWLTLLAAPTGALYIGSSARRRSSALALVAIWVVLCWLALPRPAAAAFGSTVGALSGLGLLGAAVGRGFRSPVTAVAACLLAGVLLTWVAPAGCLLRGAPWPPAVGAILLDLSPLSLTAESAGVDWMRHPFVYDSVGSASIGPELRSPWGGLAGPLCFVLGCTLLLAVRATVTSKTGLEGPPIH
jgi:hypothetical protein